MYRYMFFKHFGFVVYIDFDFKYYAIGTEDEIAIINYFYKENYEVFNEDLIDRIYKKIDDLIKCDYVVKNEGAR